MRKEALLLLLGASIYKAIRFISHSINGNQPDVVDDSLHDDVILSQTVSPPLSHIVSPPATKYDVFLSFRGEDTRHTFASHLYEGLCNAGIHTFMDYELCKGDEISQVLLSTIEESEISMIIFSENYASSKWCMDELVHILECKEKFGRFVIPIFYNVDPSNIRKQNANFGKAFNVLKQKFEDNPGKLQNWRDALIQSAGLCGWDSNTNRPESKLVEGIVKDALRKLNYNSSYHLEGLVGIVGHIRNIENLLTEFGIVGIWGMGGVGKTTIAKAVFQELRAQFNTFSFIEKVKEKLKNNSLDELQKNFLKEILEDEEISIYDIKSTSVKNRLGCKKILLVLDDVDNSKIASDLIEVLNWFGEGSRVIITSRDMQVLKKASAFSTYHVPDLDFHNSIHLFSLKAFNQQEPSEGYVELSESIVEYCQGNPLALVVLGCFFYGRGQEEWESALEKLNQDLPEDIVDVLKLSFDGLDEKQQSVFLDLAFLINESIRISLNLMRQLYDSSVLIEISVLREKSLISFDYHEYIVMHDLVKKMGLKIARQQLFFDARTRIRLWRHEDIADFFHHGKGIDVVRCLSFDVSKIKSIELTPNIFRMMDNLIYLNIYKSNRRKPLALNIRGVLNYLSKELRFLSWEECPLPHVPLHFCAKNLVRLEMRESNIRQLWNGNQYFPNLEKIDLSHSKHLTTLSDLSHTPNIKELRLNGCVELAQIHSSTFPGNLSSLMINDCGSMQIKFGGGIKGRSSGSMMSCCWLDFEEFSFHKVMFEVLLCGNTISAIRVKDMVMKWEENEELRKGAQRLRTLLPLVRYVRWPEGPIAFGHDFNQHFDYYITSDGNDDELLEDEEEERGDRGEIMKEHKMVTKTKSETTLSIEDEKDDEVLIQDCCIKSVTFTRVPNNITRWSLLTELTLISVALISRDEYCNIPQFSILKSLPPLHECSTVPLDLTISLFDVQPSHFCPSLNILYSVEQDVITCIVPEVTLFPPRIYLIQHIN